MTLAPTPKDGERMKPGASFSDGEHWIELMSGTYLELRVGVRIVATLQKPPGRGRRKWRGRIPGDTHVYGPYDTKAKAQAWAASKI